jgi:hypothetical protein
MFHQMTETFLYFSFLFKSHWRHQLKSEWKSIWNFEIGRISFSKKR